MTRFGSPFGSSISSALVIGVLATALAACGGNGGGDPVDQPGQLGDLPAGARVHSERGRITRVYGPTLLTGASPEAVATRFVDAHSSAFGVRSGDLQRVEPDSPPQPLMYDPDTGTHKFSLVTYAQERDGVPVFGADVRFLVANRDGSPLTLVAAALHDIGDFSPSSPAAIVQAAERTDYRDLASAEVGPALSQYSELEAVIFAGNERTQPPVEAVTFVAGNMDQTDVEPHQWRFVVDARTGAVLHKENLIYTDVSGTVSGIASTGTGAMECGATETRTMPYAEITSSTGGTTYTDANGAFSLADNSGGPITVTSQVRGEYFFVDDVAGSNESLDMVVDPDGTAAFLHNAADDTDNVRAQVNLYVGANEIRDWVVRNSPGFPVIPSQTNMPVYANRNDGYCPGNAWYDPSEGSINFCRLGSTPDYDFPNTAFASVIHHEYGHHIVEMGGSGQGPYGEGMSDVVAMLFSDDPNLGLGFFLNDCENPLRSADNGCQYSELDCSSCGFESHDCGRLISGAVWSARNELVQTEPADYLDILSALAVNSVTLHQGWEITPQIAIDFLTLDDDDANLDNGTPHRTEICAGFDAHGLDCPELANSLSITAPAGIDEDAGVLTAAATVTVDVAPSADLTVDLSSSDTGELDVPATVIIAAGETSATFDLTAVDDVILDGSVSVTITATSAEAASGATQVLVHDSETATISIAIPATATEGDGVLAGAGSVTTSAPVDEDVAVAVTSSSPMDVGVPASVTVLAGATTATFDLTIIDDGAIDGTQLVSISADVSGWTGDSADISVDDNETSTLSVFVPASVSEGAGVLTSAGLVQISGTLASDLDVSLGSSDTNVVTVPASVSIPAGSLVATFDVTIVDDTAIESTQSATITASAGGFTGADADIEVRDDDAHHFAVATIASPATASVAFTLDASAVSDSEQLIPDFAGTVSVTAAGDAGSHAVAPSSIDFTNGTWTGPVTIAAVDTNVVITLSGGGTQGTSNAFELRAGPVDHFQIDTIPSPQYSNTAFGVVVTALDANDYLAADFTGTVDLSSPAAVSSSVAVTEVNPGATDSVEIQNVSNNVVDTSGWRVLVSDSYTDADAVNVVEWDLPAQLQPGEVIYRTDNTSDEYFGGNIRWSASLPGWVLLVDDLLNVVDFATWGWDGATIATMAPPVDATPVSVASAFSGDGVTLNGAGTIQRVGDEDRNLASDFTWDVESIGASNTNLIWPFVAGVTSVLPGQSDAFSAGVWTGPVTFAGESTSAVLLVDDGAGHHGVSNAFALSIALVCVGEPCQNGGSCIPDESSYTCDCASGWQGDTCGDDIDECATSADDCDVNATCANTPGGYTCTCNAGYSGDGTSCAEICGDGLQGPNEECDDGDDNSDVEPNACRADCTDAHCGDGVLDDGETCDDGDDNSDEQADACRTNCALASCGDGVLDDGEACDDGTNNSDASPDACRTTCAEAYCGDGVTDDGEGCDDGAANSDSTPDSCRDDCTPAMCGDGVIDDGEECDDGAANVDDVCGQCNTSCAITEDSGGCSASGRTGSAATILLMLGLAALVRRRKRVVR